MGNLQFNKDDYIKEEWILVPDRVNRLSLFVYLVVFIPFLVHLIMDIFLLGGIKNALKTWNVFYIFTFPLVYFLLVVAHEGLHAIGFGLLGPTHPKHIKFGIMPKVYLPYTHCSKPLCPKAYIGALLLPTLVLGVLPLAISIVFQSWLLYFYGTLMIVGGVGDFLIYLKVRTLPRDSLILDHPSQIGFYVYTKKINFSY